MGVTPQLARGTLRLSVGPSTTEEEIDLAATHRELLEIEESIQTATARHNEFLKELGLPPLP